jgi:hypothetical protein
MTLAERLRDCLQRDQDLRTLVREHSAEILAALERNREQRNLIAELGRFIEERATVGGYGFYRPANPHDFSPDHESCTPEEIAAHKAACDAFDKGDYKPPLGSETFRGEKGETVLHILRAPWGIGSYSEIDPEAEPLIARARAAIAARSAP